jgi:hypothetical protein
MHACRVDIDRYSLGTSRASEQLWRRRAAPGRMKLTNKQKCLLLSFGSFSTHAAHPQSDHMSPTFAITAAGATIHHLHLLLLLAAASCCWLLLLPVLPNSQDMYFTSCGAETSYGSLSAVIGHWHRRI